MKKLLIAAIALSLITSCSSSKKTTSTSSIGDMIATMQIDEPIPGNGQVKAKAPLSEEEITKRLNAEVNFLKNNPKYKDEGMVNLIVNCKGKMVRCQIDNKTKSTELDAQIVKVFSSLELWKAGTVKGRSVDTSVLYSFKIENGVISL